MYTATVLFLINYENMILFDESDLIQFHGMPTANAFKNIIASSKWT